MADPFPLASGERLERAAPTGETRKTALHHGGLCVLAIVFFVVAVAAPLVGMTAPVPVGTVAGNGAGFPERQDVEILNWLDDHSRYLLGCS